MYWYIWWTVSVAFIVAALLDSLVVIKLNYKRKRLLTPNKILILGTFLSACTFLCPIYMKKLPESLGWLDWCNSILISMQHSIRLFAFDGGYTDIVGTVSDLPKAVRILYTSFGAFLYCFAPLLTFGLILSFFKNASAYRKYLLSFRKHTHVFSELNMRSLALAKSIVKNNKEARKSASTRKSRKPKALIVFTDVPEKRGGEIAELAEQAREIGAIIFSKDLEAIRFMSKRSRREVSFYLISDDEEEKLRHAQSIMRDYDYPQVKLRVFSDNTRSELMMASKTTKNIKALRVNDIQSLIYHNLDLHGTRLFENARPLEDGTRLISAVIVGLGKYGTEMLKALTWFCQLEGYKIKIHAFDIDKKALIRFKSMCPELMSDELNGKYIPGESAYEIRIHSGIDVTTARFTKKLKELSDATYVFVSLGNDETNLSVSSRIRSIYAGINGRPPIVASYTPKNGMPVPPDKYLPCVPDIETVIYNSEIRKLMSVKWENDPDNEKPCGVTNHKNERYDLHMIGDLEHFYSEDTLINSELVQDGLNLHCKHNDDTTFWQYEYNYRSSIARALHDRMCNKLHIPLNGNTEHVRWNAYMRTEGFSSSNGAERYDLAKLHNDLVLTSELSPEERLKDL